jgi:hypothetical protein
MHSDFSGAFALEVEKLGYYVVVARKEGYTGTASADVTVTEKAPPGLARLLLSRPGRITGRVVDEDSGRPVGGLKLRAWDARISAILGSGRANFIGRLGSGATYEAVTDAEGQFLIPEVAPGDYVVEVELEVSGEKRVLLKFEDRDLEEVSLDFENTFWPGGQGRDSAIPVSVTLGAAADIGRIAIKKKPFYSVLVRVQAATCGPEDKISVHEESPGFQLEIARDIPCGKDLLIKGFPAGARRLILVAGKGRDMRQMASIPLTFSDRNLEVIGSMERGVAIDATFEKAEGARAPDFSRLSISLRPEGMLPFADLSWKADASGNAQLTGVPMLNHEIEVNGLDAQHYIQEIRWNGVAIFGSLLPIQTSDMAHSLTVVIDDKPGTIAGSVTASGKPAARAAVMLRKWPAPSGTRPSSGWRNVVADQEGRFQFSGLAPGEYRIIALRTVRPETSQAQLQSAMESGKKIEVGPNGFQNVTLEASDWR